MEYAKAIAKAKSLTSAEDTLLVVSADHAHTMTVAGYPSRGNDILGTVDTARGGDGVPYTTISYANGKADSVGPDGKRLDVTQDKNFMSRKYFPITIKTHNNLNFIHPSINHNPYNLIL